MANNNKIYTLLVRGKRIPVTQEIYKAYYYCRDREKYLDKLAEEVTRGRSFCHIIISQVSSIWILIALRLPGLRLIIQQSFELIGPYLSAIPE